VHWKKWSLWISTEFEERILAVDDSVADQWGRLGLRQPLPVLDGVLAATALVRDLVLVTRDEDGFRDTGVRKLNPFSK
jgi:toxin FitB